MIPIKKAISIINNVHIFRILSIIINITHMVPSAFGIENTPMKIVFVWGIYLIAKDFFTKRVMFTAKYWYILVALAVSFAISVALNYPYQFPVTAYNWVYMMHAFFLYYPFDTDENIETTKKWTRVFNDIVIYYIFVLSALSLLTFVTNTEYWVQTITQTHWARQGFMENRLFGMYTSPNMGSMLGLVSVVLSIINNLLKNRNWNEFQTFYKANLIIQYLFLLLSSSRGTTLTLIASVGLIFIYGFYYIISQSKNKWTQIRRYVTKVAIVIFLFVSISSTMITVLAYVPSVIESGWILVSDSPLSSSEKRAQIEEANETISITPVTIQHSEDGMEVSSGRLTIWEAGLEAFKQRPLFGLADLDVYRGMKPYEVTSQIDMANLSKLNRSELDRAAGNMHNTYVTVVVQAGVIGAILILIFGLSYFIYHFRYVFNRKFDLSNRTNQVYLIIMIMLIGMLGLDLVENHVLLNERDPVGLIFWVYAGLLNIIRRKEEINLFTENEDL